MSNQRRPGNGRASLSKIEASRLIVEVISPTGAAVVSGLMIDQPSQGVVSLRTPVLFSRATVQQHESPGEKAHALARVAFLDSQQRSEIQWKSPNPLLQERAKEFVLEGKRTKISRTQTIEG